MRYRVLYDLDANARPCGVVVERADCVEVIAPRDKDMPTEIRQPYRILERDLTETVIEPGCPAFFDEVLTDLHRTFALGEEQFTAESVAAA